jgi:polyhydroxyalkanoate synthesis regulator phasin
MTELEDESGNSGITVISSQTSAKMGRPQVNYDHASVAVKRKMRASAKNVVNEMIEKCDDISQGDGRKLLDDVMKKTPLRGMQKEKTKTCKWNTMIEDLSQTYGKEKHWCPWKNVR